jgi:hypothetical protein
VVPFGIGSGEKAIDRVSSPEGPGDYDHERRNGDRLPDFSIWPAADCVGHAVRTGGVH